MSRLRVGSLFSGYGGLGLNNVVEVVGVDWADGDTFEMVDGKLEKRTNKNEETI